MDGPETPDLVIILVVFHHLRLVDGVIDLYEVLLFRVHLRSLLAVVIVLGLLSYSPLRL